MNFQLIEYLNELYKDVNGEKDNATVTALEQMPFHIPIRE